VKDRLLTLFQELGIRRAHIATGMEGDWLGLITQCPERVASLSLLCPLALESQGGGASAALFARCVRKASS
jgi:hypothetical protein